MNNNKKSELTVKSLMKNYIDKKGVLNKFETVRIGYHFADIML